MLNCTQKQMEVHLICSLHPAPLRSQSHHLLPQLKFASGLQTGSKKSLLLNLLTNKLGKETLCLALGLCYVSAVTYIMAALVPV